jgi:membrane associated rhomboid family serine protease
MPDVLRWLIVANCVAFLFELGGGAATVAVFALWPLHGGFMPWQLFSYAFLHASLLHLAVNMFGLWMFGRELASRLGAVRFLRLYGVSVLSAGAMQVLVTSLADSVYPTVGASGGVFGLLLAYALFFPNRIVLLLFPPIPMPAWLFVTLYALLELALGVTGSEEGVAHFAHLGGMVGSYLLLRHWLRQARR